MILKGKTGTVISEYLKEAYWIINKIMIPKGNTGTDLKMIVSSKLLITEHKYDIFLESP